jgi:hypothetical protein
MTGIQALERTMPDIAMKPGRCTLVEFEYIRHGTQSLIASFNVATGQVDRTFRRLISQSDNSFGRERRGTSRPSGVQRID